jgi:hypothetical protein
MSPERCVKGESERTKELTQPRRYLFFPKLQFCFQSSWKTRRGLAREGFRQCKVHRRRGVPTLELRQVLTVAEKRMRKHQAKSQTHPKCQWRGQESACRANQSDKEHCLGVEALDH